MNFSHYLYEQNVPFSFGTHIMNHSVHIFIVLSSYISKKHLFLELHNFPHLQNVGITLSFIILICFLKSGLYFTSNIYTIRSMLEKTNICQNVAAKRWNINWSITFVPTHLDKTRLKGTYFFNIQCQCHLVSEYIRYIYFSVKWKKTFI